MKQVPSILISPGFLQRLTLLFVACTIGINAALPQESRRSRDSTAAKGSITYKLITSNGHGYGYDIVVNNAVFVHQPFIPCVPGNRSFKTKADAKKVALLVIEKIRQGMMPPSVTKADLEKLQIDLR